MESWFRSLIQNITPRTGFFNLGNIDILRAVQCSPGLYLPDARSTSTPSSQLMITKNISKHCQMSPRGQNSPGVENH